MNKKPLKVGIVSAMPVEQEKIIKELSILKSSDGCAQGTYADYHCMSIATGIGQVNCALKTSALINQFEPDILAFSGIAGSLQQHINIGDVVVSQKTLSIDLLSLKNLTKTCQLPNVLHTSKIGLVNFTGINVPNIKTHAYTIATSDYFPVPKLFLEQPDIDEYGAIDMESSAFAQACLFYHKPFFVVRAISNFVNPEHGDCDLHEDVITMASQNAARVTFSIISQL